MQDEREGKEANEWLSQQRPWPTSQFHNSGYVSTHIPIMVVSLYAVITSWNGSTQFMVIATQVCGFTQ